MTTMTREISNYDDIIDSREVIERIEELIEARNDSDLTGEGFTDEDAAELTALQELAGEAEGYAADWKYGEVLIRDSYFKDYAMELAEELDLIPRDAQWPATCIDWEQAARELQMDYTSVEFDGVTYWVR